MFSGRRVASRRHCDKTQQTQSDEAAHQVGRPSSLRRQLWRRPAARELGMANRVAGRPQTAARAIKWANRRRSNKDANDDDGDDNNSSQTIEHVHLEVKFSKTRRRHKVGPGNLTTSERVGRRRPRLALCAYLALWLASLIMASSAEVEAPLISEQRQEAVVVGRERPQKRIPLGSLQRSGDGGGANFRGDTSHLDPASELNDQTNETTNNNRMNLVLPADADEPEPNEDDDNPVETVSDLSIRPNQTRDKIANDTCYEYTSIVDGRPSMEASIAFICAYASIFLFGLAGNLLTIYVFVVKGCKRCSAQDVLICNLAISDVMLCVFAIPITPKYLVWDHYWKMGQFLCKVVSFTQSVSVYMSTYSLIVIGFIRYRLIVHPVGGAMSTLLASALCVGTAVVAVIFTMPYVTKIRLSPDHCEVKFCDESWQGNDRFYFSLFTCVFQLSIPLLAVIFFYFNIYRRVDYRKTIMATSGAPKNYNHCHQSAASSATNTSSHRGETKTTTTTSTAAAAATTTTTTATTTCNVLEIKEIRLREKQRKMRRMNKRLLWVVCIFAFSWFPLNLYNLLSDYFDELSTWQYITYVFLITHLIACSSVVWNPFLYAWMSDSFMSDLERAIPGWLRCGRLKGRLHEPSVASEAGGGSRPANLGGNSGGAGVGGGGRCGSPTSIVMVSTNGNHQNATGVASMYSRAVATPHVGPEQTRLVGVARPFPHTKPSPEIGKLSSEELQRKHSGQQQPTNQTEASETLCMDELAATGSSQEEELSDIYEPEHENESCERDDADGGDGQCQKCQEETKELNSNKTQFFIEICQ